MYVLTRVEFITPSRKNYLLYFLEFTACSPTVQPLNFPSPFLYFRALSTTPNHTFLNSPFHYTSTLLTWEAVFLPHFLLGSTLPLFRQVRFLASIVQSLNSYSINVKMLLGILRKNSLHTLYTSKSL